MKERPILFSAPMVRAILAGTKTQTRRVVKYAITGPNPPHRIFDWHNAKGKWLAAHGGAFAFEKTNAALLCPYGQPGDRLWVREAFRFLDSFDGDSPSRVGDFCLIAGYQKPWAPTQYEADGLRENWMNVGTTPGPITAGKLRPGIHMPRWASRILLEVVSVRVERLNDISKDDAMAEGIVTIWPDGPRADKGPNHYTIKIGNISYNAPTAKEVYSMLWEQINGPGSWQANPWVWVVEFKNVKV